MPDATQLQQPELTETSRFGEIGDDPEKRQADEHGRTARQDYSVFSSRSKRAIGFTASFVAMFSGLSSFIYYPALQPLAAGLGVSLELANLTITSYLVVAGLAPSVLGDMADHTGRRPIYLLSLALYLAANVGLACQQSYAALLVLRMVQSAGASGTIAIAYGVISDIATPAERGSYVGVLMGFTNAAPSLGPVLGGILAEKASWRWIFWLLSLLSGTILVGLLLFFPETCRRLVQDGSGAATGFNQTVVALFRARHTPQRLGAREEEKGFHVPNPLSTMKILANKSSVSVIVVGSVIYTVFGCLGASLSAQCIDIYGLDYLQAGLIYLPSGIGGMLAAYTTGRLLDFDYARTALKRGFTIDKRRGDGLAGFPIEEARLRSIWYLMALAIAATAGYGWALEKQAHLAVALVLQFLTGSTMVAMFTILGTLLTDLNPDQPSTSQAAYNLVRCFLGAAGVAALQAMADGIGLGFCFTIYGLLSACTIPFLLLLQFRGLAWRQPRAG